MGTPAPDSLKRLVNRFDQNRDAYHSVSYNEAQLRHEFLGPFFEALGWDVYNHKGSAMPYRDVIFEYSLKACPGQSRRVVGASRSPDYTFATSTVVNVPLKRLAAQEYSCPRTARRR